MHRSSFPFCSSIRLTQHFWNNLSNRISSFIRLAMNSISSYKSILMIHDCLHTFCNSLLTSIEVAKTTYKFFFIECIAFDFHFSHNDHFFIMCKNFISCNGCRFGKGWRINLMELIVGLNKIEVTNYILAEENLTNDLAIVLIIIYNYLNILKFNGIKSPSVIK